MTHFLLVMRHKFIANQTLQQTCATDPWAGKVL
jgi:hypothetical protein